MLQCRLIAYLQWMIVEATSTEHVESVGDQKVFRFQVMFREENFKPKEKEILMHEPDLEVNPKKKRMSYSTLGFPYSHEPQY
jgi:hypothetical protein